MLLAAEVEKKMMETKACWLELYAALSPSLLWSEERSLTHPGYSNFTSVPPHVCFVSFFPLLSELLKLRLGVFPAMFL